METRSVALIILYVVVGFFIYVWLAIPAGYGWDQSWKWADVATWISAVGTLAAVIVALRISLTDGRRRDQEKDARGRVIAAFLFADVGIARRAFQLAQIHLDAVRQAQNNEERIWQMVEARLVIEAVPTEKIVSHLDKLADLPGNHAIILASLPDSVRALRKQLPGKEQVGVDINPGDLNAVASACFDQASITKAGLDAFMVQFEPNFVK